MKKTIPYLLFLATLSSLNASIFDDFLDTQKIKQLHLKQNELFQQHPHESKLFENIRFNIEHSDFDTLQRKYGIRAYTRKPGSVKKEQRQYALQKKYIKQMQSWDKNRHLQERYTVLIEALKQHNLLKLTQEQISFEQKTLQILASYVQDSRDILKLETIKNKIAKLKLQYLQSKQSYINQLQNIKFLLQNPNITIDAIKNEIQNIAQLSSQKFINFMLEMPLPLNANDNITLLEREYSINLAKERLQTLNDQEKIGLDNLELEYDDSKKSKNALSFGLSFNIPIHSDQSKIIKEKLKLSSANESYIQAQDALEQQLLSLKNEIEYNINYLTLLKKELEKGTFKSSVSEINFNTLKFLLDQKAQKLEVKKKSISTLYKVKKDYLTLLYLTKNIDDQQFKQLMINR